MNTGKGSELIRAVNLRYCDIWYRFYRNKIGSFTYYFINTQHLWT